jgi:hypothetical protein
VDLEQLLSAMDRAAANRDKLERVWERARPLLPAGPSRGSEPEYDDLARAWKDLLTGLPAIDEWTITEELPNADDLGKSYIAYSEFGGPPFNVQEEAEQPTGTWLSTASGSTAPTGAPPASASKSSAARSTPHSPACSTGCHETRRTRWSMRPWPRSVPP